MGKKFQVEPLNNIFKRNRSVFVDRIEYMDYFWDKFNNKKQDELDILVYYGIGGIGKTGLRKEIQRLVKKNHSEVIISSMNFENNKYLSIDDELITLRQNLRKDFNIKFNYFDVAYANYIAKSNPKIVIKKDTFPFLEEGTLLYDILEEFEFKDIPGASLVPKFGTAICNVYKSINGRKYKNDLDQLIKITQLEANEIIDKLSFFLAEDIRVHLGKTKQKMVMLVDTYELVSMKNKKVIEKDKWLKDGLVKRLPEVIWVFFSREPLQWNKYDDDFDDTLNQYELIELENKYSKEFLLENGIEDEKIYDNIFRITKGHLYYLNLFIDIYEKISANGSSDKLHSLINDMISTPRELFESFIKYFDKNELDIIFALSVANFWNKDIFESLIKKFNINYSFLNFQELIEYSFVSYDNMKDIYYMHSIMRKSLLEHMDKEKVIQVHEYMFSYYNSKLQEGLNTSRKQIQGSLLAEAFYHLKEQSIHLNKDLLTEWFVKVNLSPNDFSDKNLLLNIGSEIFELVMQKKLDIKESIAQIPFLNEYAKLSNLMGEYGLARILYEFIIDKNKYNKLINIPFHIEVLNSLTDTYYDQCDYSKCIQLYDETLEIINNYQSDRLDLLAKTYNYKARSHQRLGNYESAEEFYQIALQNIESVGETDDCALKQIKATILSDFGDFCEITGNYNKAIEFQSKALEIKQSLFDENHYEIAFCKSLLANAYTDVKAYDKAKVLYQSAIDICNYSLRNMQRDVATIYNDFGWCYQESGDYLMAEKMYTTSLEIINTLYPESNLDTARTLQNLASVKLDPAFEPKEDNINKAISLTEEAIRIHKKFNDTISIDYANAISNLSNYYLLRGQISKAIDYLEESIKLYRKILEDPQDMIMQTKLLFDLCISNHGGNVSKYKDRLKKVFREDKLNDNIRVKKIKIGRNELCSCGSGKKYKKCCGINEG
ncbi:tetratricopeptide repeat protein [Clostridium saccharoperbutylacetonicum]